MCWNLEIVETQVSYGQCKNLAEFNSMENSVEAFRFLYIQSHMNAKRIKN